MTKKYDVVFAGTPEIAARHLKALIQENHLYNILGVYTQPDRKAGRGRKLTASPVKQLAMQHDLPIFQPHTLKDKNTQKTLQGLQPDIMVVVAYGLILPKAILEIPRLGCINIHVSLLPRWRGAAPIQRAIEMGDSKTGVSIMKMDKGLDTGDVFHTEVCQIFKTDNSQSLHDRLAKIGSDTLIKILPSICSNQLTPIKQSEQGTSYAHKITKDESSICWQNPAKKIVCKIKAFNPWPITTSIYKETTVRILDACISDSSPTTTSTPGEIISIDKKGILVATNTDIVTISRLQFAGGKPLTVQDVLNAKPDFFEIGTCFQ